MAVVVTADSETARVIVSQAGPARAATNVSRVRLASGGRRPTANRVQRVQKALAIAIQTLANAIV